MFFFLEINEFHKLMIKRVYIYIYYFFKKDDQKFKICKRNIAIMIEKLLHN